MARQLVLGAGGVWTLRMLCFALLWLVLGTGCGSGPEPGVGDGQGAAESSAEELDLVLRGGRVIDPETGLDAVRDVGIRAGQIVAVSEDSLEANLAETGRVVDVSGLVVAPGFIDLHAHGHSPEARDFQVLDGVTTALELEWGVPRVGAFLEAREGRSRIHYGASVSHGILRGLVLLGDTPEGNQAAAAAVEAMRAPEPLRAGQGVAIETFYEPLPSDDLPRLFEALDRGLGEGGLGLGMAHQYYPGATRGEILSVFEYAAGRDVPIFTHVRSMGIDAMQEVVANAASTGAAVHIVHVNSSGLRDLPDALRLIEGARTRGIDVSTETYPYTAASTSLQSSIFDPGWQDRLGITEADLQWESTGERLTPVTFARYREQGGTVIIHMMQAEMIELALRTPFVMVASDGMPYAPGAHPRSAGTFARVLGRYVREQGVIDLPTAIAKMTLLPAQRLEGVAPQFARKGRIQVGSDADVTVFDPAQILDTATFEDDLSASEGVRWVLVDGVAVVEDGELVDGAFPGQAMRGRGVGETTGS